LIDHRDTFEIVNTAPHPELIRIPDEQPADREVTPLRDRNHSRTLCKCADHFFGGRKAMDGYP
jgi:hypothetical protein